MALRRPVTPKNNAALSTRPTRRVHPAVSDCARADPPFIDSKKTMTSRSARLALFTLAAAALAGCGKKETPPAAAPATVALVADSARSPGFLPTVAHLDVGGPVFAYCDTEGDPLRIAESLLKFYTDFAATDRTMPAPPSPEKLAPALQELGLANLGAFGLSSRRDGAAFVNRAFLYTPGGPGGLTTLFGTNNADFSALAHAPANTVLLAEGEFDGKRLLAILRKVVPLLDSRPGIDQKLERALTRPLPNAPLSLEQLVGMLSGKTFVGVGHSPAESIAVGPLKLPALDLVLALDHRAELFAQIKGLLAMSPTPATASTVENFELITLRPPAPAGTPFARYAPVFALEKSSGRVWFATNRATFDAWTKTTGEKLTTTPEFRRLAEGLPVRGTGLFYLSPNAAHPARALFALAQTGMAMNLPRESAASLAPVFNLYRGALEALFPEQGAGVYSVSTLLPDGLATQSRSPVSNKPNAYLWVSGGPAPIVAAGVGAATAIPAFKKVRGDAIEKTLSNDARKISAAANQYMVENSLDQCTLGELLGPGAFIAQLSSQIVVAVVPANSPAPAVVAFAEFVDPSSPKGKALVLRRGDTLLLGHPDYDRKLSPNPALKSMTGLDPKVLRFSLDTGAIIP